jgi:hypothetical protein
VSVVYVAGTMRSGTTALGQAVAASPDAVLLGEVRPVLLDLREPGALTCGCGRTEAECAFWSHVERLPSVREQAVVAFGTRGLPALLAATLRLRRPSPEVVTVVERLRVLGELVGDHAIVDTSKTAAGILLWHLAGHRVHVAHCLRTPREVIAKQAAPTDRSGLPQSTRTTSAVVWVVHNLLAWALQVLPGCDRVPVHYRRLCADPTGVVAQVWAAAGIRPGAVDDRGRFAGVHSHLLVGNPRRDRSGVVRIGGDVAAPTADVVAAPPVTTAG